MKKNLELHQIDAFSSKAFEGNAAAITFGDGLTNKQKQLIAREMNLSETAFLSKSKRADFKLQWFTPTNEVKLCGHATIASLHFLKTMGLLKSSKQITFETLSGILKCYEKHNKYFMQLPVPKVKRYKNSLLDLYKTIGLSASAQASAKPPVIVNNEICYVNVKDLNLLQSIKPNFNSLLKLAHRRREFRNLVVYTLDTFDKSSAAHSRCFPPFYGINEDPVTGSTNGPLLLVLQEVGVLRKDEKTTEVTFEQGDLMGRKGRIGVTFSRDKNELYISGNAVTVMKGTLVI